MTPPGRITQPLLDVLQAFVDAGDTELHGWAIRATTGRPGPTVYKLLARLQERGWMSSRWPDQPDIQGAPRRRYYRLTEEGAVQGRALLAEHRPRR